MANYSLVVNSKFKPYSFDELVKPYLMYKQAYDEQEKALSDLSVKANVWKDLINPDLEANAYKNFSTYTNDLENSVGTLSKYGLTPAARQAMINMKKRYASEITPIEVAYTTRQKQAESQQNAKNQNSTLEFSRWASTTSLDEYMKNPQLAYDSYSGKQVAEQVSTAVAALSKRMQQNPVEWKGILGNQYFQGIIQKGFSPEAVLEVLEKSPNASPILKKIVDEAVSSTNVRDWNDEKDLSRAYNYANSGLWNAVGDTQYQIQSNKDYDYAMQEKMALDKEKREEEREEERRRKEEENNKLHYRAVPKTTVNGDVDTNQVNDALMLLQEISSDPRLIFKKDTRLVRDPKDTPIPGSLTPIVRPAPKEETYFPYQEKLSELTKKYGLNIHFTETDGKISSNLSENLDKLKEIIESSAIRSFSYKPNITQSDLIAQVLRENVRSFYRRADNTGVYELDEGEKSGSPISIDDLNDYFISDSDIDFDADLGFVINATNSKGETRSAVVDTELLDDPYRTFSRAQQAIKIALDNNEPATANSYIKALMKAFYKRFNTLEKRESNTFSKEEK